MLAFYDNFKQLNKNNIGTVFPMNASLYQTDMLDDTVRMFNVNGKSIDSVPYILYSNVGNDFSDKQIKELEKWTPRTIRGGVLTQMILFENPALSSK